MMGWLIAAAVLILVGMLPIGLCFGFDEKGFSTWIRIWHFRIALQPEKEDKKKRKKATKKASSASKYKTKQKKSGKLNAFLPYLENILEFTSELGSRLTVRELEFKLILAGSDPADLAVNYGRAWAVLGNLMPRLESFFRIRRRDLEVECDFLGDGIKVTFYMDVSITIGGLLRISFFHGSRILRKYLLVMKKERVEFNHE